MDEKEKIQELLVEYERLKFQVGILVSQRISEKDTLARRNDGYDKAIEDVNKSIEKIKNGIMDILYGKDRISGLVVEVDRLRQESERQKKNKQNIIALWIAVVGVVLKTVYDLITKK